MMAQGMVIYLNVSLLPERELTVLSHFPAIPSSYTFYFTCSPKKVLTNLLLRFQALVAQVSASSTLPDRVQDPAIRGGMNQSSATEDQRFM